jgi:photosystem II stability/assembly factor-like uncharacterized protein
MDTKVLLFFMIFLATQSSFSQNQWQQLNSGTTSYLRDLHFISEDTGWVIGHGGIIIKTTDGGITWIQQNSGTSSDLYNVSFIDEQKGWVGGLNGILLKTTNGGETWQSGNISVNNIYGLVFLNENIGCAVTGKLVPYYYSHVYRTTNGGNFWGVYFGPLIDDAYLDLFGKSPNVWAVGTGVIARSTNDGQTWYSVFSPTDQWLYDVFFFDNTTGWAVGGGSDSEVILKTANGGVSWQIQRESYQYQRLQGVFFTDLQNGWTVGEWGIILRTTNGGTLWTSYTTPTNSYLREVQFPTQSVGYIVGENGTILKYSDNSNFIQVLDPNGGEVIIAGSMYYILWNSQNIIDVKIEYSTNNGVSWLGVIDSLTSTGIYEWIVPSTLSSQGRIKVSDLSNPNIFDISDQPFIIQSSKVINVINPNGGEILDGGSIYEINWSSNDVEDVKIEYSVNNGASWNLIVNTTPSTGIYLWNVPEILTTQGRIKISDITTPSIYDVSDNTFRINYTVDVNDPSDIYSFKLLQNYPNPFNPSTRIEFSLPEYTYVNLSVYDVLGNLVGTLISEHKDAGNYNLEFNASNIPSGLYFYKIITSDFIATKKMILLK